jgi:GxxExxY protein
MYKEEGYKLMGAAFEVYNEIGYGLSETIYQQSTEVEMKLRSISFVPKIELRVHYKGHQLDAKYIPDFMVFDAIVAELKAVSSVTPEHEAQLFNYM